MKLRDANLQVNEKNFFLHPPSCILLPSFSQNTHDRSSRPNVFLVKGVLKICSKFTGEQPCRSVISIKLQSNFFEITLRHGCSPVNLLHIFRTPFPRNTSGWVLLTRLLFPKKLWKFTSTISFRKYKRKVVIYPFNYDSSKSTFFMLNMAFDVFLGTVFVT